MAKPIIYQMLPRLWGNNVSEPRKSGSLSDNGCGKFNNVDDATLDYLKSLSVSHVWLTGVIRHATQESVAGCEPSSKDWVKGKAGSPYAINDYYDVNPYLADNPDNRMAEFEDLLKRIHGAGLKVIIDFVPNHVARDYGRFRQGGLGSEDDKSDHWLPNNDFFYYPGLPLRLPVENQTYVEVPAKASGNNYTPEPTINDWYDTIKLNYCDYHTPTWDKMLDIVLFWASKGVDGFRCDMVELVPADFLKWMISEVKKRYKKIIFIAEIYQKSNYEKYIHDVGFDYLYDKSGLYDALRDVVMKNVTDDGLPVEEWQSTKRITWNWQSLKGMDPHMLNFLENHDEQRFASDFFGKNASSCFAPLYASALFDSAAFMIYFGEEVGERGMDEEGMSGKDGRTTIFDWWSVASLRQLWDYIHNGTELPAERAYILDRFRKLFALVADEKAFSEGVSYDLCYCQADGFDKDRHFAFLRHHGRKTWIVACNFSPWEAQMKIVIPKEAFDYLQIETSKKLDYLHPLEITVPAHDGVVLRIK